MSVTTKAMLEKENANLRRHIKRLENNLSREAQGIHPKQDIQALTKQIKKYRMLAKFAAVTIYEVDFRSKRFTEVDEVLSRLTGYSRRELLKMSPGDILAPEDLIIFKERLKSWMLGNDPPQNIEYHVITKDGHDVYALINIKVKRDTHGIPWGATVIGYDITSRKQAEIALMANEARYSDLASSISGLFLAINRDWIITYTNADTLASIGLSPKDAIGKKLWEIYPDRVGNWDADVFHEVMEHREYRDFESYSPTQKIWYECRVFPSKEGIVILGTDISERKRAEAVIRQLNETLEQQIAHRTAELTISEDNFKRVFLSNAAPQIITTFAEGCILDINDAGCRLSEFARDELIGRTTVEAKIWEISDRKELTQKLRHPGGMKPYEITVRTRSGAKRQLVLSSEKIEFNGIPCLLNTALDITERISAMQELERSHAQLHSLSRQLMETQEKERRYIGRELHDEIGQSLTGLRLLLQMAQRPPVGEHLDKLELADQVVEELLDRISALSLDLRPTMLDDMGLLPALLWFIDRYTSRSCIKINFLHTGLEGRRFSPVIETAGYRLIQEALTNIARHARVERAFVHVKAEKTSMEISINDTGEGFDVETVLDKNESGGLSGMRERVRLLNGKMEIDSAPGQGTHLFIQLPLDNDGEKP